MVVLNAKLALEFEKKLAMKNKKYVNLMTRLLWESSQRILKLS